MRLLRKARDKIRRNAMPYQALFTFRTHGGVCAGEQWIYDHDEPIARFEHRIVEQPEQNLRYFDKNPKPVNLRDLKLTPGGRPLISGAQLYWVLEHGVITSELVRIETDGEGTDRLTMAVITRDPFGVATSRRILTLTYDATLGSYIYDFMGYLDIHSPEVFDRDEEALFEYCDPWYVDIPGPTVSFPGMWKKRYSYLLAELADGTIEKMPLNHMATSIFRPTTFKRGGLFLPVFDPGNHPAFEFVGETADRTAVSVCNWGYDIHCRGRYTCEELYERICAHFRIRLCPDDQAQHLLDAARPVPSFSVNGFDMLPLYERHTSFSKGLKLNEPTPGDTDPWPWLPEGEGTTWCTDEGRSDRFSLKISKEAPEPAEWRMEREGVGAWTEAWNADLRFRISVYIKTADVQGRGSCAAVCWAGYNYARRYPYVCSERLTGTHDWTRVSVEIYGPPPPDISSIHIVLRQDGSGTTWFDDLDVEIL